MIPILFFVLINTVSINGFLVDVLNITKCRSSDEEIGELIWDINSEETIDQEFSGSFVIPLELHSDAYVEFQSFAWDEEEEEWKFLFNGLRSVCNSILKSLPYESFRKAVKPNWPHKCPIPDDSYDLNDFPISGQYFILSDIKHVSPLVKTVIKLWAGEDLILCRKIHTISTN